MRLVSGVSATAAMAAAALAGCSSGGSGTTSASGSSAPASTASSSAPAAAGGSGSTGSSGTGGTGGNTASPGTASSSQCQTRNLSLRVLTGATDTTTTAQIYVQLTNSSSQTCTLYGFPGVELLGGVGAAPKPLGMKDNWTLKLAQTGGKKVQTLKPGDASAAYVTFATRDPGASADIPRAEVVQVIPPNQKTALTARIFNVESGKYVTPLVLDKTLNVGPMDINGVPHK